MTIYLSSIVTWVLALAIGAALSMPVAAFLFYPKDMTGRRWIVGLLVAEATVLITYATTVGYLRWVWQSVPSSACA